MMYRIVRRRHTGGWSVGPRYLATLHRVAESPGATTNDLGNHPRSGAAYSRLALLRAHGLVRSEEDGRDSPRVRWWITDDGRYALADPVKAAKGRGST